MPNTPRAATPAWRIAARRACRLAAALAIGAMAWAAAHDILRGEPDPTAEWAFLVFAGLLGACSVMGWAMRSNVSRR